MIELSPDEARRLILRAQGLLGSDGRRGGVHGMLRRLGAVQLDTISVLARSHELVAYARLGAVGRSTVEKAYWDDPATSFEYWCHAACILPIENWPLFAFRRRAYRERRYRWHEVPDSVDKLLQQVRDNGPLTTADVGGAKNGGPWWDWSDSKIGLEWLLDIGEVVCTRRVGWRRVYDLAERTVPAELLAEDLTDEECIARLAAIAGRSLGVATRADLVDFLRVTGRHAEILDEVLASGATGLVPVYVHGWPTPRGRAAASRTTGSASGSRSTGRADASAATDQAGASGRAGISGAVTDASSTTDQADSSGASGSAGADGSDVPGALGTVGTADASDTSGLTGASGATGDADASEALGSAGASSATGGAGTSAAVGSADASRVTGLAGVSASSARTPNAWADPAALASEPRGRHRTTLVSPFDSLIWHRGRTERIFGFNYQLELYVPKHKRVHGYFTMPVLAGGRLIGRVDPAREGTTLVARKVSLEPGLTSSRWIEAVRDALWSAATWVGCDSVRVDQSDPPELATIINSTPMP